MILFPLNRIYISLWRGLLLIIQPGSPEPQWGNKLRVPTPFSINRLLLGIGWHIKIVMTKTRIKSGILLAVVLCISCNSNTNTSGVQESSTQYQACNDCNGTGKQLFTCEDCDGDGYILSICNKCGGNKSVICPHCYGKKIVSVECTVCSGVGYKTCNLCKGTKENRCVICLGTGSYQGGGSCPICHGNGKTVCVSIRESPGQEETL